MKKNLCVLRKNILIILSSSLILLFSLVSFQETITMSYAKNPPPKKTSTPSHKKTPTPSKTTTPIYTPTSSSNPTATPTATPIPGTTPVSTQQAPQVTPTSTTPLSITPLVTENPTIATPVSIPQSDPTTIIATPTSVRTIIPILLPAHLQNRRDNGIDAFTLSLVLGFAAPSLMISAGALWLLVKWLMKKRKLAREKEIQASPGMQASFQGPQFASSATSNITIPSTNVSEAAPVSTLPAQPTYTTSDLLPITLAPPQQMSALHSKGGVHYPPNGDLQPLPMPPLDLCLEVTRAIESNGNGYMPPILPDTPTGLADIPTSSMPSSSPKPLVLSVSPSTR